jgi:glycosyltransferase involved in cell wall biosynthesis
MKVLHIITSLDQGGAEAVLYRLIEATHKKVNHSVVSLHDAGVYGSKLRELGVSVETLDMPRGRLKFTSLWRLRKIILSYSPDIIHTKLYHADLVGGVVALLSGAPPVIWTVNSSDLGKLSNSWKTRFIRRICAILSYGIPSAIIVDADNTKRVNVSLGYSPKKFSVINNGTDLSSFYPDQQARQRLRHELQIQEDIVLLGFIARWDPLKDHSNFLQALSIIKNNNRKFACILVGNNMTSQNAVLMELIHKNVLDEHIILLGPRSDIPAIMNALDLHILSSFSESMPNVIIEAMACGTPCVVTDVGDAALVVGNTGWVARPKDAKALGVGIESAIKALKKNGKDELGQRCRRIIEEKYSLDVMVESYVKLWEKTVGEPE